MSPTARIGRPRWSLAWFYGAASAITLDRAAVVLDRLNAIRKAEATAIARVESGDTDNQRIRDIVAAARIIGP